MRVSEGISEDADLSLRLKGKIISRISLDTALSLEVLEKGSRTVIRIGGKMIIEHSGGRLSLSGEDPAQAKEAAILLGKAFRYAMGHKDGSLHLDFTDGTKLIVPVDPDYEAWEVSADDGFLVVSAPGGGLSAWRSRPTGG